jgi:small-conductance mechanosensitive channel
MRLTVEEYCKHFKMSKEMIHSKLRNKKLNYIIENGTTYIIVPRSSLNRQEHQQIKQNQKEQQMQKEQPQETNKAISKPKTTVAMVIALYQKENQQLKEKIALLEAKIDKLIDDKEQMLRDEMNKIEQVYAKKDEQLKNILELMNTQLIANKNFQETEHEVEPIEIEEEKKEDEIVELKTYLKTLDLEPYQRKIIKKRFLAVYDKDIRIIKQNGKLYLNFSKYDYSDLLEY